MQEAIAAKKDIAIVYDFDKLGRVLQVGYLLKDRNTKDVAKQEITWFNPSEIQITRKYTPVREFRQACLDIEFTHPRDNERHFLLNLPLDSEKRVILRNLFRVHSNSVTGFVIQVEIRGIIDGKEEWRPVVRYDCAHGFIHRDMIYSDGHKTKHQLGTQDTKGAIVLAIDELRDNLNPWLQQMGYTPLDPHTLSQPRVIQEMDKAKSILLDLHDDPEKMSATQSSFVQIKDELDYNEIIWPPSF